MGGLDLLAPCPICHLALTEALNFMQQPDCVEDQARYKEMLAEEGLEFNGKLKLYHTLDLLHDVVGLNEIAKHIKKPFNNQDFAGHYGCHLIRASECGRPDKAEHPEKLENLLELIGLQSKDYPEKLNCCGGPLILNLPDSALTKAGQKLKAVSDNGFAGLVDMCPWGHRLFDARQKNAADTVGEKLDVPVFYLTQLIGLGLGMSPEDLGLHLNLSPIDKVEGLVIFGDSKMDDKDSRVDDKDSQIEDKEPPVDKSIATNQESAAAETGSGGDQA
jgi:heterodisulfide reductase subunit B